MKTSRFIDSQKAVDSLLIVHTERSKHKTLPTYLLSLHGAPSPGISNEAGLLNRPEEAGATFHTKTSTGLSYV